MAYVVIAKWTAKPGEGEAVAAAIARLTGPSRAEPGCLTYRPSRELANPRVFWIYEEYVDEPAFKAHGASEHFARHARDDAIPRLESRELVFGETLES